MALSSLGVKTFGMDLVVDQFDAGRRIANENKLGLNVLGADAAALPFGNATFNSITMVETFEHIYEKDRATVLAECHRVLRAGGRIVLSTPNYKSLVEWAKRVLVRLPHLQRQLPSMCYPDGGTPREDYHPYQYHRPWSDGRIAEALVEAGFTVRKRKFFLFVMKNTPDAVFGLARLGERTLEKTPVLNHLAATVCLVADK
jgi:ubiquinone/menaquinone biosynthesis C-methylase UbiE